MGSRTAIRVISMETARERRNKFSDDAKNSGLAWSYFDALRRPAQPLIHDAATELVHTGRVLRAGEIGCYSSHYSVWCWFLQSENDQLIVFEDDVVVDWSAVKVLCDRDLTKDGIDILKLFTTYPAHLDIVRYKLFSDHSHLVRLRGYCYGTQAYLLTKRGASALVQSCARLTMPIDWAMSRYWDYGIDNYAVFPFPVIERLGPSSIGHAASAGADTATLSERMRRLAWRCRDRASRAVADARRTPRPFGIPADAAAPLFNRAET